MDDNFTQYLKYDVELNFAGPSPAVVNKWAADVLRALADRLEKEELTTATTRSETALESLWHQSTSTIAKVTSSE